MCSCCFLSQPRSLIHRTRALAANLPLAQNRPGLGVPVLPPIAQPPSHSPPVPAPRRHSPPPPYFAEQEAQRPTPPKPTPRAHASSYSLPNPLPSMLGEEREEVESIAGMGFPPARVARAHRRYSGNRTKVGAQTCRCATDCTGGITQSVCMYNP